MTTLQKYANSYVDEGGSPGYWDGPQALQAVGGGHASTRALNPPTVGPWLRLGFDLSALPAGSLVSGVVVQFENTYKDETLGSATTFLEGEYWDGTEWQTIGTVALTTTFTADPVLTSFVLAASVLTGWANGYGIRIRVGGTGVYVRAIIDAVNVTVTYAAPSAPTATAISPAVGSGAGGSLVTITGTEFQFNDQDIVSGVTVGGVACTEVGVLSATSLTCRVGAHAAGTVDVVVTNAGGSGTQTNGFTYLSVVDATVKVVKGGAVSGASQASADLWPSEAAEKVYGGPTELWDSLTIADVNASNFGFVLSATVGTGALGRVDFMAARFYYGLPGLSDPASYLALLRVDADRQTHRPDLYQLPRNGFSVSNDPQIDRRITAGAEFRFSRQMAPGRLVEKVWHSRELWLDESVSGNTPGLQVWARVDEGTEFQLLDAGGTAVTLRGTGAKEVFFPKGDAARGHYMQLIYRVPTLAAGQVAAAYGFRDGITHLLARPKRSWVWETTLVLAGGEFEDKTTQKLSGAEQLRRLEALAEPGRPAVEYRDPQGGTGYLHVIGLQAKEVVFKEGPKANVLVANVKLRAARYE